MLVRPVFKVLHFDKVTKQFTSAYDVIARIEGLCVVYPFRQWVQPKLHGSKLLAFDTFDQAVDFLHSFVCGHHSIVGLGLALDFEDIPYLLRPEAVHFERFDYFWRDARLNGFVPYAYMLAPWGTIGVGQFYLVSTWYSEQSAFHWNDLAAFDVWDSLREQYDMLLTEFADIVDIADVDHKLVDLGLV